MIVALEPVVEEEVDNMNFVDLYAELEALETRVMVQSSHIRWVKLEADREAYQPKEWLEGFGDMTTQEELKKIKMSKEEAEQQLGDETVELNSVAEWQLSATKEEENDIGDQDDLPTNKEELQLRRLHKEKQQLEQLDRVIEEIRRLMLRSTKEISKEEMNEEEPEIAAGKKKKKNQ